MSETRVIPSVAVSKMLEIVDSKEKIEFLLVNNEEIELVFTNSEEDNYLWITSKRIIIYTLELGLFSRKHKGIYMVYPLSKISSFTANTFDISSQFLNTTIYSNGIPQVILKLHDKLPVEEILHLLSSKIL